jgi:allophanate hydrolase subunit 2
MLKIIAAVALSAYVVYDATTAPGLTRTGELRASAIAVKGDRLPTLPANDDCSDTVWPYYPSACLTRATLRVGQTTPERPVRFVTTLRAPANVQSQAFAQFERQ